MCHLRFKSFKLRTLPHNNHLPDVLERILRGYEWRLPSLHRRLLKLQRIGNLRDLLARVRARNRLQLQTLRGQDHRMRNVPLQPNHPMHQLYDRLLPYIDHLHFMLIDSGRLFHLQRRHDLPHVLFGVLPFADQQVFLVLVESSELSAL